MKSACGGIATVKNAVFDVFGFDAYVSYTYMFISYIYLCRYNSIIDVYVYIYIYLYIVI